MQTPSVPQLNAIEQPRSAMPKITPGVTPSPTTEFVQLIAKARDAFKYAPTAAAKPIKTLRMQLIQLDELVTNVCEAAGHHLTAAMTCGGNGIASSLKGGEYA